MSRPILHATDFSPASRAAFAKAIELARRDRAPLVIAHVMTPPLPMLGDGYVSPATWDEIRARARAASSAPSSARSCDSICSSEKPRAIRRSEFAAAERTSGAASWSASPRIRGASASFHDR